MAATQMESLLALIERHLPSLDYGDARSLPSGQFHTVLCLDERWIFRFPRSPHVSADLAHELLILPRLRGRLPLPIPAPQYSARDESGQVIFMAYAMLPGMPLLRERFAQLRQDAGFERQMARDIAGFLQTLHSIRPGELGLTDEHERAREGWRAYYAAIRERLFPYMREDARRAVSVDFEAALAETRLWQYERCLTHGDIGAGNILVDQGRISGIIDFSFCKPGDPAQDLGALLASYGGDFARQLLAHYPALGLHLPRAEFYRRQYALLQALFALRDGDQAEFEDGIKNYR